jgi:protein SCO1
MGKDMVCWEQKTARMFRIVFLLLSNSVFLSCVHKHEETIRLPYYNAADFTPLFISKDAASKQITHVISDFRFLNQDSTWITNKSIEGKIHAANFIFTRCGSICPVMTNNFKIVANEFQDDPELVLLSYSVTPWIDDVQTLQKYKSGNRIKNSNWHFLTGDKSAIYTLARQSYFAEEDIGFSKDSNQFLHTEHVILVDKNKRIRGVYNGTLELEMQQLADDIRTLKKEDEQ